MPNMLRLKSAYMAHLKRILVTGALPYIDIESACKPNKVDIEALARRLDDLNIGLMALSADPTGGQFKQGVRYDNLSERLLAQYPDRFIPVGNGGQPPFLTEATDAFFAANATAALQGPMLLLGEFEMRHYPSPRQVKRGELDRDVDVPLDGPIGHQLFALSERLGIQFQLHYEIEELVGAAGVHAAAVSEGEGDLVPCCAGTLCRAGRQVFAGVCRGAHQALSQSVFRHGVRRCELNLSALEPTPHQGMGYFRRTARGLAQPVCGLPGTLPVRSGSRW